jgi:MinD-like ATPase involved in chromosome partitioning or flagellar assembly
VAALTDVARAIKDQPGPGQRILVAAASTRPAANSAGLTLAREISTAGRAVLIDLAPPLQSVAATAGDPAAPGLFQLIGEGRCSIRDILTRDRQSRLHLVTVGPHACDVARIVASPRFAMVIEALTRSYDFVLLDAQALAFDEASRLARILPRTVLVAGNDLAPGAISAACERLRAAGAGEISVAAAVVSAAQPHRPAAA